MDISNSHSPNRQTLGKEAVRMSKNENRRTTKQTYGREKENEREREMSEIWI